MIFSEIQKAINEGTVDVIDPIAAMDAAVEAAGTASPYFYTIHEPNFETPIPGSTAGSYDYAFHQFWDSEESRLQGLAMFEQTAPAPEGPQPDCIQESFLFESLPLRSPQM